MNVQKWIKNEMQLVLLQCRCHEVSPIPHTPNCSDKHNQGRIQFVFLFFWGVQLSKLRLMLLLFFFFAENYLFQKVADHLRGEGVQPLHPSPRPAPDNCMIYVPYSVRWYGYHQRENTGSRLFTEVKPCNGRG